MLKNLKITIEDQNIARFIESVKDDKPVGGLTHDFYRYPASVKSIR